MKIVNKSNKGLCKGKKRKDGIPYLVITIVFLVFCLVAVPVFKTISNSNATNANAANTSYNTFSSESDTFTNAGPSVENPYN